MNLNPKIFVYFGYLLVNLKLINLQNGTLVDILTILILKKIGSQSILNINIAQQKLF